VTHRDKEFKMDITISGYDGENVIAQIIEDLLSVNGLCVKREDFSPIHANLSIDQLDRQLNILKKNKVMFNIKVVKEDRPKYAPKAKISKIKSPLDMANMRAAGRMPDGFDDLIFGEVAHDPRAVPAAAPVAAPAYGYNGGFGPPAGAIRLQMNVPEAIPAIGAIPAAEAPVGIAAVDYDQALANAQGALAAGVDVLQEQIAAMHAEVAVVHDQMRNDIAELAGNQIGAQQIAGEMPIANAQVAAEQAPRFEYRAGGLWGAGFAGAEWVGDRLGGA
jgi:hypothetical protein